MIAEVIANLLMSIPASFWGVVMGSVFSITGVYLTNRANDSRHRSQSLHDQQVRAKDRDVALKKEIYLAAIEALYADIGRIRALSRRGAHKSDQLPRIDAESAVGKVALIGRVETIKSIADFELRFAQILWTLTKDRMPIVQKETALGDLRSSTKYLQVGMEESLKMMESESNRRPRDQDGWKAANERFSFYEKAFDKAKADERTLLEAVGVDGMRFATKIGKAVTELQAALGPVLVELRKELEIPTDEEKFLKHLTEQATIDDAETTDGEEEVVKIIRSMAQYDPTRPLS